MLIFSIFLYFALSFYLCKWIFGELSFSKLAITIFLAIFAVNVLIFQALSIFDSMGSQLSYLILQMLICGVAIALLVVAGGVKLQLAEDFRVPELHGGDFFLVAGIGIIMGGLFYVGINTAPNNLDSIATHIPRIYYWLQHGNLERWPAINNFQLTYPVNANLQGAWLFLLGRSENLFFLVQWYALGVLIFSAYEMSRLLGFAISRSLLSAIFVVSFPVAILQAYSFQGDVTVAALVMVSIVLGYAYLQQQKIPLLLAGMLSFFLALGTKQTAFFVLPILLFVGILWYLRGKIHRNHRPFLWLILVFIMVFSAPKYIQNRLETGSFFGVSNTASMGGLISADGLKKVAFNAPRYFYNFLSMDGIPTTLRDRLIAKKAALFQEVDATLGLNLESPKFMLSDYEPDEVFRYASIPELSEDTSWLGPLAFLLLPLATIVALFSKNHRVREYALFALLFGVSYSLILILQRPGWDRFQGRYFILAVMPSVPLISALVPSRPKAARLVTVLIASASMILALNTLFFNISKPVLTKYTLRDSLTVVNKRLGFPGFLRKPLAYGLVFLSDNAPAREPILSVSRDEQVYFSNRSVLKDLRFVESQLADNSGVSVYRPGYLMEFGLFGKNAVRQLFPILKVEDYNPKTYLVAGGGLRQSEIEKLHLLAKNARYRVFKGWND